MCHTKKREEDGTAYLCQWWRVSRGWRRSRIEIIVTPETKKKKLSNVKFTHDTHERPVCDVATPRCTVLPVMLIAAGQANVITHTVRTQRIDWCWRCTAVAYPSFRSDRTPAVSHWGDEPVAITARIALPITSSHNNKQKQ